MGEADADVGEDAVGVGEDAGEEEVVVDERVDERVERMDVDGRVIGIRRVMMYQVAGHLDPLTGVQHLNDILTLMKSRNSCKPAHSPVCGKC